MTIDQLATPDSLELLAMTEDLWNELEEEGEEKESCPMEELEALFKQACHEGGYYTLEELQAMFEEACQKLENL